MGLNRVEKIDEFVKIENVLVSVSDKKNLEYLIPDLLKINPSIKIFSTGGTYSKINEILYGNGKMNLLQITDYTGQPEMQGGLVKTLDFKIYIGLLSETYNETHKRDLERLDAEVFDLIIVNLYPFEKTVAKKDVTLEDARANIDIGGPAMLRASAKNFLRVASVCDPTDYKIISNELEKTGGKLSFETRLRCAKKAFLHTAGYDTAISEYLINISAEEAEKVYSYVRK